MLIVMKELMLEMWRSIIANECVVLLDSHAHGHLETDHTRPLTVVSSSAILSQTGQKGKHPRKFNVALASVLTRSSRFAAMELRARANLTVAVTARAVTVSHQRAPKEAALDLVALGAVKILLSGVHHMKSAAKWNASQPEKRSGSSLCPCFGCWQPWSASQLSL